MFKFIRLIKGRCGFNFAAVIARKRGIGVLSFNLRVVGAISFMAGMCFLHTAGRSEAARIVSLPSGDFVAQGGSITLDLTIDDADGLQAVDFVIFYDTSLLDISGTDIVQGSPIGVLFQPPTLNVDDSLGTIGIVAYRTEEIPAGTGGGGLFRLTFHASPIAHRVLPFFNLIRDTLMRTGSSQP